MKGVPVLLDALGRLAPEFPGLRATLVGDGPEGPALEARARALGLGDRVHFAGYQSQDAVARILASRSNRSRRSVSCARASGIVRPRGRGPEPEGVDGGTRARPGA